MQWAKILSEVWPVNTVLDFVATPKFLCQICRLSRPDGGGGTRTSMLRARFLTRVPWRARLPPPEPAKASLL